MRIKLMILMLIIDGWFGHASDSKLFKCNHTKFKKDREIKKSILVSPKRHSHGFNNFFFSEHRNMRIKIEPIGMEKFSQSIQTYYTQTILQEVKKYFESNFKVKGPSKIPPFNSTGCFNDTLIPASYQTNETDADLILFVFLEDLSHSYFAFATSCLLNDYDNRPVVGIIVANVNQFEFTPANIEISKITLTHEIIHVLGFDPDLFESFPIGKRKVFKIEQRTTASGTFNVTKIILPQVVEFAKKYYQCKSIDGIFLEDEGDQGSIGSHWEKTYFGNEIIKNADILSETKHSNIKNKINQ